MTPIILHTRRPGPRRVGRIAVMLGTVLLLAAGPVGAARAASGPGGTPGQTVALFGGEVSLSEMPQATDAELKRLVLSPRPRGGTDDAEYARRKAVAASHATQQTTSAAGPPPSGVGIGRQTPNTSVGFTAQKEGGSAPSDMALAVGPVHVVQVINTAIAVYNKNGFLYKGFPKSLSTFFPGTSGDLGDPRAFFDWNEQRFVVTVDDFTRGRVWLAASKTSDPTGSWNIYSFAPWGAADCRTNGAACADFPQLGFSDGTIMMGVNFFQASGAISDWMLMLPKIAIYSGQTFSYNFWSGLTFNGVAVDSVQPVSLVSASEHPRASLAVNSFNINYGGGQCQNGCNGLAFWLFSNNLPQTGSPGPELSAVSVATATTYRLPAAGSEPGCAFCVDTGDVRISAGPTLHAGVITGSLNTNGSDGHSHVLWFQARPFLADTDSRCTGAFATSCPRITGAQLLNEDCYICGGEGAGGSTYYGALAPDDGGDLSMVFAYSDSNTYPSSAYVSRRVTQSPNTMHDSGIYLCNGAGAVSGRWGDYFAAVPDLSSPTQGYMWFAGDVSQANGEWSTCIGRNAFTSGTQP